MKSVGRKNYVFISYVREDEKLIDEIVGRLKDYDISLVWDKESLAPGKLWKIELENLIVNSGLFLAFFSTAYLSKYSTYMNEELRVAIEELRKRHENTDWFVPIRLDDIKLPDIRITSVWKVSDLQYIDFHEDFDSGLNSLLGIISKKQQPFSLFNEHVASLFYKHINSKIDHYKKTGVILIKEIVEQWSGLIDETPGTEIAQILYELRNRTKVINHETVLFGSRYFIISYFSDIDIGKFLENLVCESCLSEKPYINFILDKSEEIRNYQNWKDLDLVHIVLMEDDYEFNFDILYYPRLRTRFCIKQVWKDIAKNNNVDPLIIKYGWMFPTSILSSNELSELVFRIQETEWVIAVYNPKTGRQELVDSAKNLGVKP